jgi:2-keto-3-deoxy-L-rhamnonate aldolase RhmA
VVKGDIMEPELGLTEVDRAAIVEGVDVVIHCAADIRLECCIQVRGWAGEARGGSGDGQG